MEYLESVRKHAAEVEELVQRRGDYPEKTRDLKTIRILVPINSIFTVAHNKTAT
jgi:hypothetical protein